MVIYLTIIKVYRFQRNTLLELVDPGRKDLLFSCYSRVLHTSYFFSDCQSFNPLYSCPSHVIYANIFAFLKNRPLKFRYNTDIYLVTCSKNAHFQIYNLSTSGFTKPQNRQWTFLC